MKDRQQCFDQLKYNLQTDAEEVEKYILNRKIAGIHTNLFTNGMAVAVYIVFEDKTFFCVQAQRWDDGSIFSQKMTKMNFDYISRNGDGDLVNQRGHTYYGPTCPAYLVEGKMVIENGKLIYKHIEDAK